MREGRGRKRPKGDGGEGERTEKESMTAVVQGEYTARNKEESWKSKLVEVKAHDTFLRSGNRGKGGLTARNKKGEGDRNIIDTTMQTV